MLNLLFLVPMLYMLQVYDRVIPTRGSQTLFFQNKPDDSSGTGLIQAIVRVQDPGGGDGTEDGYNTSFRPLSYEENTSPQFTTSLLLSEVPKALEIKVTVSAFSSEGTRPRMSYSRKMVVFMTGGPVG